MDNEFFKGIKTGTFEYPDEFSDLKSNLEEQGFGRVGGEWQGGYCRAEFWFNEAGLKVTIDYTCLGGNGLLPARI